MNKEQFSTAMLTLVALVGMVLLANTVMAQSGQPWDEEYDSPAKLTTMTVDTSLTNLQTCRVARSLKRNGTLTAKGKREACKPNRLDNRTAFWTAFAIGMATPRYPYYYYYGPRYIVL